MKSSRRRPPGDWRRTSARSTWQASTSRGWIFLVVWSMWRLRHGTRGSVLIQNYCGVPALQKTARFEPWSRRRSRFGKASPDEKPSVNKVDGDQPPDFVTFVQALAKIAGG